MSLSRERDSDDLLETQMLRINRLCNEFEAGWRAGRPPVLEQFVHELTGTDRQAALRDLLPLEIEYRQRAGETVLLTDYANRFPEADRDWLASLFYSTRAGMSSDRFEIPVPERLGDYQILGRLGGGGMGTVYKALHVRMGRVVALKVLRSEIQQNPVLLQRFDREVRAAARLNHPNIVAALDAREQDGLHFLITEFIDGLDLDATVRLHGPLPVGEAIDATVQAARGLSYAHQRGVIHRDIKPANLLRDRQGGVKVLDMGLARLEAETGTTATNLTNSGMVLGTAAYMSPEQARDVRRADARSDLYSLGCTFYYLLTGCHAYSGATALDTVLSHLSEPIPLLTDVNAAFPPALQQVFGHMVAKNPVDRLQSAEEVVAALEKLQLSLRSVLPPTGPVPELPAAATAVTGAIPDETPTISLDLPQKTTGTRVRSLPNSTFARRTVGLGACALLALTAIVMASSYWKTNQRPALKQEPVERVALSFNGTTSYAVAPDLIPQPGASYTLEAVVTPVMNRRSNVISWLGPDWMALYLNEGRWGLARRVNGESHLILADAPAEMERTVHLAGVYRGSDLRLFVDGQPIATSPAEFQLPQTSHGLYIGGVDSKALPADQNDRFFGGLVHAVRVTSGRRYTQRFQVPKTLTKDATTVALYQLQSRQGTEIQDLSGNGNDAVVHDAEWVSVAPR